MSNYAICTMQKFKSGNIGGYDSHVKRKYKNHSNQQIDNSKSHLNKSLIQSDLNLRERIDKEIKENYTKDRAIRKDAVLLNSFIITASQEYMHSLDRDRQIEYFETALEFFQEEYGNIVTADIHFDETNPHLHLGLVPLVEVEEKEHTTLSSKRLFGTPQKLRELQDNFANHMQEKGFDVERGIQNNDKVYIKDVEEFKRANSREVKQFLKQTQAPNILDEIADKKANFFNNINYKPQEHEEILKTIENLNKIIADNRTVDQTNKILKSNNDKLKKELDKLDEQIQELEKTNNEFREEINEKNKKINNLLEFHGILDEKLKYGACEYMKKLVKKDVFKEFVVDNLINKKINSNKNYMQVNEIKNYAYDYAYEIAKNKSNIDDLNLSDRDLRVIKHYARKSIFNILNNHEQVISHNGYYEFVTQDQLKERQQFYDFINRLNYDKSMLQKAFDTLGKVDRETDQERLFNKIGLLLDKEMSNSKTLKQVKKDLEYSHTQTYCFTKKEREVLSKTLGKEIQFSNLYKDPQARKQKSKKVFAAVVNSAFSQPKKTDQAQAIAEFYNKQGKKKKQYQRFRDGGIRI